MEKQNKGIFITYFSKMLELSKGNVVFILVRFIIMVFNGTLENNREISKVYNAFKFLLKNKHNRPIKFNDTGYHK